MVKRLLIIGGSGFLGSRLVKFSKGKFETYCTYKNNPIQDNKAFYLDLENVFEFSRLLAIISPDIIIFAARFENSQKFTKVIDLIRKKPIRFIFLSSDAVFDGHKGEYSEKDTPNPLTNYGKKKREFEKIILRNLTDYVIIRTGFILGKGGKRSSQIISCLKEKQPLKRFNDIYRNPIDVKDLAQIILELANKTYIGIIHIASKNVITPFSLAKIISNVKHLDNNLILADSFRDSENKDIISPNTTLNTSLMEKIVTFKPKRVEEIEF